MAEALPCEFDGWLAETLARLNTDDEVFTPYIKAILEGDENHEEKVESLQSILTEITENGIEELCEDILSKWSLAECSTSARNTQPKTGVDDKLARLMEEQQAQSVVRAPTLTQEQQSLKKAILAQYAQVSDGEGSDCEGDEEEGAGLGSLRNTNAEDVAKAQREKREKNKEESQRKKEKDKEDRVKQKTREDDRKEKEKKRTQKGERRR